MHVDGAFGLFAAAAERLRHLTAGYAAADSWGTDAHKTLNVPYDCGIAIVARPRRAEGRDGHARRLPDPGRDAGDPFEQVPELSRRARALPVWAVLRALGAAASPSWSSGWRRHAAHLRRRARARSTGARCSTTSTTRRCASSFGSDERTREVVRRVLADGTAWMSGSRWHGRAVLRISVSNWSTTDDDVERSLAALSGWPTCRAPTSVIRAMPRRAGNGPGRRRP